MTHDSRPYASLFLVAALAACGDDSSSTSGGDGGGAGTTSVSAGSTTTSNGTTSTTSSQTTSSGGDGGGGAGGAAGDSGAGGQGPISCDDDVALCAQQAVLAQSCGLQVDDDFQAECEAYTRCERVLFRDDVECALFTCRAELENCSDGCGHVLDDLAPSALGEAFLERCSVVMLPCEEEATEVYCGTTARVLDDVLLEDFVACLDAEGTCSEVKHCFDLAIQANPECPDL
jgi:hypothetical protein